MKLKAVITRGEEHFLRHIQELPAVLTQGTTIDETRANLIDALELYLEDMREEMIPQGEIVYQQKLTIVS